MVSEQFEVGVDAESSHTRTPLKIALIQRGLILNPRNVLIQPLIHSQGFARRVTKSSVILREQAWDHFAVSHDRNRTASARMIFLCEVDA
jgi:hypothetical protein